MKKIMFYNACNDGTARSIIAGCYKLTSYKLLSLNGWATMTCVIEYDDNKKLCDKRKK
jgi:hypothetical protein